MNIRILFIGAFAELKGHWPKLLPVLALPLLVVVCSEQLFQFATDDGILVGLISVMQLFFYLMIPITIHRAILIGSDAIRAGEMLLPRKRIFIYWVYLMATMLIMLPLMAFTFIPVVGELLITVGYAYFFSRFCLVLPAIAIDMQPDFGASWRATKHHQLALFCSIGLFPFLASYVERYAYVIPYVGVWMGSIVTAVLVIYTTAMLSVAFERLRA